MASTAYGSRIRYRLGLLGIFAGIVTFYVWTAPENRTESDDRFAYALRLETGSAGESLRDSRLMLFHSSLRALYVGLREIGLDVSGLDVLQSVSVIAAALSVILVYHLLSGPLGLSRLASLVGAGTLAVSYGFWRYATEADVYSLAAMSILVVITVVARIKPIADTERDRRLVLAGVLAGLSVLLYRGSGLALFLVLPLTLWRGRYIRNPLVYLTAGTTTLVVGYLCGFLATGPVTIDVSGFYGFLTSRVDEFHPAVPSVKSFLIALLTIGHNLVSSNWIFGFEAVAETVATALPHKTIEEEIYAAQHAGWLIYVPLVLLPILFGLLALSLPVALASDHRATFDHWTGFFLGWAVTKFALIAILGAGLESGILVQVPLAILAARVLFDPCVRAGKPALAVAMVVFLFLINIAGGLWVVRWAEGDYHRVKSAWVLATARSGDLVLVTRSNENLGKYVRYSSPATVHRIRMAGTNQAIEDTLMRGGRVFVFDDFLKAPQWLADYARSEYDEATRLAELYRARSVVVAVSDAGAIYEIR